VNIWVCQHLYDQRILLPTEVVRVLWMIMVLMVVNLFRMCSDRLDFVVLFSSTMTAHQDADMRGRSRRFTPLREGLPGVLDPSGVDL
jgi:hypothetical protein